MIEIVAAAWRQALQLPAGAPAPAHSWEAAGGDSLAMLALLLDLETRLGRKLDYALIEPDMDVAAMAAALATAPPVAAAAQPIFLLPGQFGDGPSLARFRNRLGARWPMTVVELPGLDTAGGLLADMAATGHFVAERIAIAQPQGAIRLAGYSYGGGVALEAAHRLQALGRDVAFIGILDTAFGAAALGRHPASDFRNPRRWQAHRIVLALLIPQWSRRLLLAGIARLPAPRAIAARNFIARRFRTRARGLWQPRPLAAPTFVAVSAEFEASTLATWQALLPRARIARLPGRHYDIFRGDTLETLATAFEAALAEAGPPAFDLGARPSKPLP